MPTRPTAIVGIALLVLVGSGLGVALAAPGVDAPGDTATNDHAGNTTIQVSAAADASTAPDTANVRLAVVATADTAEAARAQVAENASRMRTALGDVGVDDDQVRTTYFDITAVHGDDGTEVVGYRAVHGFEVEVGVGADVEPLGDRTGTVVDTAVANGASQVEGVQFTLSEETRQELRRQALDRAMGNAREDATVVAAAEDLTVTGVVSVSTADVGVRFPEAADRDVAADATGTSFDPGPVTVSATVSVTYSAE